MNSKHLPVRHRMRCRVFSTPYVSIPARSRRDPSEASPRPTSLDALRVDSPPWLTIVILRERSAGPPKTLHDPGATPRKQVPDRRARRRNAGPPKFSEKNIACSWMYAPGRSSTKKEGDLRGEGWDCNRVKKKEERVLGTQTEKT